MGGGIWGSRLLMPPPFGDTPIAVDGDDVARALSAASYAAAIKALGSAGP